MPASTESEMFPAMRLSTMAEITASPLRKREEEPTETICQMIWLSGRNRPGDSRRRLRRVR